MDPRKETILVFSKALFSMGPSFIIKIVPALGSAEKSFTNENDHT